MVTAGIGTKTKWAIDTSHSEIGFNVKHLMISNVKGVFKEFEAGIYTTGKDFVTSEINVWINTASIDSGDEKRDSHLKSSDFFDVENHKQITFTGHSYEKADAQGNYELWGDLSIKGITKRINLDIEFGGIIKDPWGNEKAGFIINGKINRKDWGLTWNTVLEAGGVVLSNDVKINCEVQLIKQVQHNL